MGRKSNLTEKQWAEVERRLLAGERVTDLAREFKVSKSSISRRCSAKTATVKDVAQQILQTEQALKALPVAQQIQAVSLADEMRAISFHLAGAARLGAATAHRLLGIANDQVGSVDDAEPEKSGAALGRIGVLTKLANESAHMGLNLLAANKEQVKLVNADAPVTPVKVTVQVEDASVPEPAAQ